MAQNERQNKSRSTPNHGNQGGVYTLPLPLLPTSRQASQTDDNVRKPPLYVAKEIRGQLPAPEDEPLKLPPMIPGHVASLFTVAIPERTDEAIKNFRYVDYSLLSCSSPDTAPEDKQDISMIDWMAVSETVESVTLKHHGSARSEALKAPHKIVWELRKPYDWAIACYYDRITRELMAKDPRHDSTTLNQSLVSQAIIKCGMAETNARLAAQEIHLSRQPAFSYPPSTSTSSTPSSSSTKRFAPYDSSSRQSRHTRSSPRCFRCGVIGHLPVACNSELTSAGLPCASWIKVRDSRYGSLFNVAKGKTFCRAWARDAYCRFENHCKYIHKCSICGETQHGATFCPW